MKSVRNVPSGYSQPYIAPIPVTSLYLNLQIVNDGLKLFTFLKIMVVTVLVGFILYEYFRVIREYVLNYLVFNNVYEVSCTVQMYNDVR